MKQAGIARKHLVLVGGGHSHVVVVKSLGMRPEPGLDVTLIAKELDAPYSGMLPGLVAGHYDFDQCHIDLVRLAGWAGVRIVHGTVSGIDRKARRVLIDGRASLGYDLLSIDVGITPRLDNIKGAEQFAIAVKPVSTFAPKWRELEARALTSDGPRRIAVAGAGAGGFELILAVRHRLRERARNAGIDPEAFHFALIGAGPLLPTHNARARALARAQIARQGVELIENDPLAEIAADRAVCKSGREVRVDALLAASKAGPAEWFKTSSFPLDGAGYIAVRPTLQLLDDDDAFAVGDCAGVVEHPREKAGVFAVRQGPPLTDNIRLRARGMPAKPFTPQRRFLTLLATGPRHAIAARGVFAVAGAWAWRWKDHIDQTFMRQFNVLPAKSADGAASGDDVMRCAGCAAKVGPGILAGALRRIEHDQVTSTPIVHDDAAIVDDGGPILRLETVDFFRGFWPDPYLLGEIAAQHAMNDIHAMGGRPVRALATMVLPNAASGRVEEDLYQMLAGARAAFDPEGVALAGGHSSEGKEPAIGFFVAGEVARDAILRKGGLAPGDKLILTRPIGSAILLAALMRGQARARHVSALLAAMRGSNASAVRVIARHGATAGTDVTGFGLAGHLLEMLTASETDAVLSLASVPLYDAALAHARSGIASSLLEQNVALAEGLSGDALSRPETLALLFDPQTSGGLLVGVPADRAEACLTELRVEGASPRAAIIGEVIARAGARPRLLLHGDLSNAGDLGVDHIVVKPGS